MKANPSLLVEFGRAKYGDYGSPSGAQWGAFLIDGPCGQQLKIIASAGNSSPDNPSEHVMWEHVSVSCKNRCPNWQEMCYAKSLFWDDEETVMQLHPPKSQWINDHPYCLHLWKPLEAEIPMPPPIAVGEARHH